jgi:hypothetical protein
MKKQLYLLQNLHSGYMGNYPFFWRQGGSGYTTHVDEAEQFDAARVREIINGSRGTHKWKRWKLQDVMKAAVRVADMQTLRELDSKAKGRTKEQAL